MQCKRCATLEAELEFPEPSTPHVDFLSQEGFRRKISEPALLNMSQCIVIYMSVHCIWLCIFMSILLRTAQTPLDNTNIDSGSIESSSIVHSFVFQ